MSAPGNSLPTGLATRIVPCLDVRGGRVVKGVNFSNLRDAGDPVACAERYEREGADELVILDVSATLEEREAELSTVRAVRAVLGIPLTVGGGVHDEARALALLEAGADKVAVNSAAVADPSLITRLAERFGSQCTVVAIDAFRRADGRGFGLKVASASREVALDAVEWAREAVRRGAGEILLTSIDRDGTRSGYDCELVRAVANAVPVPVVASGGAENPSHLVEAARAGAQALLAASMFHDGDFTVAETKAALTAASIPVRPSVGVER